MTELPSATFPLVFFDGDRDSDVGSVTVTASLDFYKFRSLIANKIGLSHHQISISLVRRKKTRSSPEMGRRVSIDEASDFATIARERDCFVLVAMRRSRSGRRSRGRRGRGGVAAADDEKKAAAMIEVPEMTILKRNPEERVPVPIGSLGFWDYETQLMNLQTMKEKYLLSTIAYFPYAPQPMAAAAAGGGYVSPPVTLPFCVECFDAKMGGKAAGFHRCVNDKITVGFRSPVGPIERPTKKNVDPSG